MQLLGILVIVGLLYLAVDHARVMWKLRAYEQYVPQRYIFYELPVMAQRAIAMRLNAGDHIIHEERRIDGSARKIIFASGDEFICYASCANVESLTEEQIREFRNKVLINVSIAANTAEFLHSLGVEDYLIELGVCTTEGDKNGKD